VSSLNHIRAIMGIPRFNLSGKCSKVSGLVFPRQLIKWRLVATSAVAIFWYVELLMLVVFDVGAMLIAPTIPFSIKATWFHKRRIQSRAP